MNFLSSPNPSPFKSPSTPLKLFLNRSANVTYQRCNYKHYLQYRYKGVGIVPKVMNRDLLIGGFFHEGAQYLLNQIVMKMNRKEPINMGVESRKAALYLTEYANEEYRKLVGNGVIYDGWTATKDTALVSGLVYLYGVMIVEELLKIYRILAIEKPTINHVDTVPSYGDKYEVWYESRADIIVQHKESNEVSVISYKTTRYYPDKDSRIELSHLYGEQEISEVAMARHWVNQFNQVNRDAIENLCLNDPRLNVDTSNKLKNLLEKTMIDTPSSVKMIYIVKGKELTEGEYYQSGNTSVGKKIITYNPIVRGFINYTDTNPRFAHSEYYNNPANASGKGKLGKGWEPFHVWEYADFADNPTDRVLHWIDMIRNGVIQPDEDSPLTKVFYTQPDIYIGEDEIKEWLRDLKMNAKEMVYNEEREIRKNRDNCAYPTPCEYLGVCRRGEPIDMDMRYKWREPHHIEEKLYVKEIMEKEKLIAIEPASKVIDPFYQCEET